MQDYFFDLVSQLKTKLHGDEILNCSFSGEDSDFVRLNNNRVRHAGRVTQRSITVDLIAGRRHARSSCDLSGDQAQDLTLIGELIRQLRMQLEYVPEDPYLSFATEIHNTEQHFSNLLPDSGEALELILTMAQGLDLVGILASGVIYSGFANTLGQHNWHSSATFNFDWSCYHEKDKAVKNAYAGFDWNPASLQTKLDEARTQLEMVRRPSMTIKPGKYRAYLAPAALLELLSITAWGGFSLKGHRTAQSPLIKMSREQKCLHPEITLTEHHARGFAPIFTSEGFIKQPQVRFIDQGVYKESLVNPRSAMEYQASMNSESEYPESLDMAAGKIGRHDILKQLDTGLYINNLWYCNFSDRNNCQITGMTRFACFWVEQGIIQSPINVMRFDESIYDLLGNELIGLTREREMILDASTYQQRSTRSYQLPGALVAKLNLTL